MKLFSTRGRVLPTVVAIAASAAIGAAAQADLVIEFTGMDLVYDGSALYDAGSAAGGFGNPADGDALSTIDFFVDGGLVGSVTSDIWLDMYIPDVTGIPAINNGAHNLNTVGNPGFFDVLIGNSPLASEFLLIDLGSVSITYIDIAGIVKFTFAASISPTYAQNLPFDLGFVGPVTLSFSAQIDPASLTTDGEFITGFTTFGTGEVTGAIPAPGALALLALGGLIAPHRRRRS